MLTAVVGTLYQRVQPNSEGELFAPSLKKTSSMTIELLTEAILSKEEMDAYYDEQDEDAEAEK